MHITRKKTNMTKPKKKKLEPILCKKCKHNMGRSRCKPNATGGWDVRCNKCKSVFIVTIIFPKEK